MIEDKWVFALAIGSLCLYIIKIFLLSFSGNDISDSVDDFAVDFHDGDAQDSFSLFSFQSLLAFLMGSSWTLLAARHEWHVAESLVWILSILSGCVMMLLSAFLLSKIKLLNSQGSFDLEKSCGKVGQVYLPIPPKDKGFGQVEIIVDGRKKILKAVNNNYETIRAFTRIVVLRVESGILVVTNK